MHIKERSLVRLAVLNIITFGFYSLYWSIKTKNEINQCGGDIPTGWYLLIPFANIYFWYKYAESFAKYIKKDSNALIYFLLAISPIIINMITNNVIIGLPFNVKEIFAEGLAKDIAAKGIKVIFYQIELFFFSKFIFQLGLNEFSKEQEIKNNCCCNQTIS